MKKLDVIIDGIIYKTQKVGGISRIFNEIIPIMCDLDSNIDIKILLDNPITANLPVHNNINFIYKPKATWRPYRFSRYLNEYIFYKKYINKNSIWHSTYFTSAPRKMKSVVTVYDMIYEMIPDMFDEQDREHTIKMKRESIMNADLIICISETTRQDVLKYYNVEPNKCLVIYPAYSNKFHILSSSAEIKKSIPYIFYLGQRVGYKGFINLLVAYANWEYRDDIKLIVVGGYKWRAYERTLIDSLGISNNVILYKDIDDDKLCHLYNEALAFIYPSLYEGFGIPLLEAMACGCLIVASHIPSTVEVAGDIPIYFEIGNIENLQLALNQIIDKNYNRERIKKGLEKVKTFSWKKTAEKTLNNYRKLV